LRAIHPLGKSPVVTDGGRTLAESGAIIEYLVDRHGAGRLRPVPGSDAQLRYTYWLHYAEGSLMSPLLLSLIFTRMPKAPMPFFVRPVVRGISDKFKASFIGPQLKLHLDYVDAELGKAEWFAGTDFSAADVQMSFPLEVARARGALGAAHPHCSEWLDRIHARPAYRKALETGGPFDLLT
jgi:glutathione S-transferase